MGATMDEFEMIPPGTRDNAHDEVSFQPRQGFFYSRNGEWLCNEHSAVEFISL